ncbi:hypothetical protein KIN20_032814 [Parelaphostrongylus tenuis]|uniref:Uncharacterized protein n=1 Tax=Parelaphostrongylus tenuis TaxID=148309 RepID=A0AAD5R7T3_PARTN|nr:hypothetical protein KIN20_032814 [Parelaphostrongylus tenuis]
MSSCDKAEPKPLSEPAMELHRIYIHSESKRGGETSVRTLRAHTVDWINDDGWFYIEEDPELYKITIVLIFFRGGKQRVNENPQHFLIAKIYQEAGFTPKELGTGLDFGEMYNGEPLIFEVTVTVDGRDTEM